MTRDERIEAALEAAYNLAPDSGVSWGEYRKSKKHVVAEMRLGAAALLDAAYPELAGENPTHWLTPMEKTDGR